MTRVRLARHGAVGWGIITFLQIVPSDVTRQGNFNPTTWMAAGQQAISVPSAAECGYAHKSRKSANTTVEAASLYHSKP